ncbi:helical backbone metal receptor [Niabella yanshanensis]|uniref:Helical backbone metal receptor n=1 Tax=Niabella yanshanensis TaxID=577386 RepID=A0ABZ0WAW9_9BACT|nr:helical backbone metal receptor [Niabella yanshanensis]WQD40089.1 helical backbone metal receptor [Niabella yanshanensis]
MRIISLVPSITELLYHLGLNDEVVGITKFCVHPQQWHETKPRVGSTKNVHTETVKALHPTLIIASKEENIKEQVNELSLFSEILLTDVSNFDSALQMIDTIGILTGKPQQANHLISKIQEEFQDQARYILATAAYLIWKDPWMTVGRDTFIHSMMGKAGFRNVMDQQTRYPVITIKKIQEMQPQYVFLSSEPYPFKKEDIGAVQELLPSSNILLVDGEMFSWYGSRMLHAAGYFKELRDSIKAI